VSTLVASRRPSTVSAAVSLLVLLAGLVLLPVPGAEAVPREVLGVAYAFAALKLVAAAGLWRCRRWAAILGFLAVLLDALAAAPGLLAAPTPALRVMAATMVLLSVAALILLALPTSRRAYV
jgi:hypothetical protein